MFLWDIVWKFITGGGVAAIAAPILDGYRASLAAGNTTEKIAADLASRELAVQQREIEVQSQLRIAQIGHWSEPEHLFAYTLLIYFAKIILWDKVLGPVTHGSTDPLEGAAAIWSGFIITFLFGKRGFENVARIIKAK